VRWRLYAEKLNLDRLAQALVGLGDRAGALQQIERTLAMATAMSDWRQVANLLWRAAALHDELGRRDLALARAEATVDLLRRLDNPRPTGTPITWRASSLSRPLSHRYPLFRVD